MNETIQHANCDCVPRLNRQLWPDGAYILTTSLHASRDSDVLVERLTVFGNRPEGGRARPVKIQFRFCPFCGKANKTSEEIAELRAKMKNKTTC